MAALPKREVSKGSLWMTRTCSESRHEEQASRHLVDDRDSSIYRFATASVVVVNAARAL